MGATGGAPPAVGTVEVLEGWRPGTDDHPSDPPPDRRAVAAVAVVLLLVVVLGLLQGDPRSEPGDRPGAAIAPDVAAPAPGLPTSFTRPLGHRVAALTVSGVAVLDPDDGGFEVVELGAVTSYGSRPALVAVGPDRVAVLFSDRSVGLVDLTARTITRVAEDVNAILPGREPGRFWVRRLLGRSSWELTLLDADGQPRSVALTFSGADPPTVVGGRPTEAASADAPVPLPSSDAGWDLELRRVGGTVVEYEVRIEDQASGSVRWLRGLRHPPVVAPDGGRLLYGVPDGNLLVAHDLVDGADDPIAVPRVDGVDLDWGNLAVLPDPETPAAS